jgi:predicted esterase
MFDAWSAAAEARGIAVLALQCPRDEGCTSQSWWRWDGDPGWIVRQTEQLGHLRAVDTGQMWIVGWSGGASYIGRRSQEIERSFAAIVIHGGGIPPAFGACSAEKAPVYFLTGDANPLHGLAVRLREHYDACGNEVTWTLLPRADHMHERSALAAHREAILSWLSRRRLVSQAAPGGP